MIPASEPPCLTYPITCAAAAPLPEVSELQAVRHYTRLSQKNYTRWVPAP
ncbi:hypothetical protein [Candidatus Contendibacter odensensis]|uniref:Uncharacterized protein n=1 Tax=Candidatus Contendobacter odensis Run_B_J11 TaxID=1400861 RepID=A0A7U7G7X1_9GAMM|nr:hypothetical protein [Candidatus Competibacteraceae bacterium]CDH43318.1 hypothetical protein BN874_1160015 [Candidatus Contendobacter odensis Run_B_J11]